MQTHYALGVEELRALVAEAWASGEASMAQLDEGQAEWCAGLRRAPPQSASVWNIGRRRGKTFAALAHACWLASQQPGRRLLYAAKTGKSARAIVEPTMAALYAGAPPGLAPELHRDSGSWLWPNGSRLVWAGVDNDQFDRLRGPGAHLLLLDEAAFYPDLPGVESALLPQLMTTGGVLLYLSSPPLSPDHPYAGRLRAARAVGLYRHDTVHGNPRLTDVDILRLQQSEADRLGLTVEQLVASTYWRREYLAELVAEQSTAAVPSWTQEAAAELVGDWQRPEYFDAYVAADWGYSPDPSLLLWGFVEHGTGILTVEHELVLRRATISQLAAAAKSAEDTLYGPRRWDGTVAGNATRRLEELPDWLRYLAHEKAPRQPWLRVGDNDPQLLAELATHGYGMLPSDKHHKAIAVDAVVQAVAQRRIRIHTRCIETQRQLMSTQWNSAHNDWVRTDSHHGEAVDALVYMWRSVDFSRDLRPKLLPPMGRSPTSPGRNLLGLLRAR
ncbi:MAG: terminase family protein [Myxococcaceae bacterium]|nr:terminase family protein [Myxococcaceae bacterium]